MRIVLDTNVVLSALLWTGTPHHLLELIRNRRGVRLYSSPTLLEELADVLGRPFTAERLARIDKTPQQVLADYLALVELVEPTEVPRKSPVP